VIDDLVGVVDETHLLIKTDLLEEVKAEFQAQVSPRLSDSSVIYMLNRHCASSVFCPSAPRAARGIHVQSTDRGGIGKRQAETTVTDGSTGPAGWGSHVSR
jgi:hypothetical protein